MIFTLRKLAKATNQCLFLRADCYWPATARECLERSRTQVRTLEGTMSGQLCRLLCLLGGSEVTGQEPGLGVCESRGQGASGTDT